MGLRYRQDQTTCPSEEASFGQSGRSSEGGLVHPCEMGAAQTVVVVVAAPAGGCPQEEPEFPSAAQ